MIDLALGRFWITPRIKYLLVELVAEPINVSVIAVKLKKLPLLS
jgi:hypothetical protein